MVSLKDRALNYTIRKINGFNRDSLSGKVAIGAFMVPFTWLVGACDGHIQEEGLKQIGIDKKYAKYVTLGNAIFFGLGTSIACYHGTDGTEVVRGRLR